jgi:hypothetical protein
MLTVLLETAGQTRAALDILGFYALVAAGFAFAAVKAAREPGEPQPLADRLLDHAAAMRDTPQDVVIDMVAEALDAVEDVPLGFAYAPTPALEALMAVAEFGAGT